MPDVVDQLRERYAAMSFGDARVIFVLGHPRSGIGKGNLVARLASLVDEPTAAVKFEAMLNTNDCNNHPSPTDDVGTYARFCPGVVMGWPNQILGGEVIRDFIDRYGGTNSEHLMFVPHLSQHLALHFNAAWKACGCPSTLFVELGGTLGDPELGAFVLPCVAQLKRGRSRVGLVLLTELPFDGSEPKTRSIRQALDDIQPFGVRFDVVFLRMPAMVAQHDLEAVARQVEAKIRHSYVYGGDSPVIAPIPHFPTEGLDGYLDHLARYVCVLPHGPDRAASSEQAYPG